MRALPILTTAAMGTYNARTLIDLPKFEYLKQDDQLSPFETIAHIKTYDEIPIFGGVEFRNKVLQQT